MRDMEDARNAQYVEQKYRNAVMLSYCVECQVTCNLILVFRTDVMSRFQSRHKPYTSRLAVETEHIFDIHQWR